MAMTTSIKMPEVTHSVLKTAKKQHQAKMVMPRPCARRLTQHSFCAAEKRHKMDSNHHHHRHPEC